MLVQECVGNEHPAKEIIDAKSHPILALATPIEIPIPNQNGGNGNVMNDCFFARGEEELQHMLLDALSYSADTPTACEPIWAGQLLQQLA